MHPTAVDSSITFSKSFFQPCESNRQTAAESMASANDAVSDTLIVYSPEQHGSHADFCQDKQLFAAYKRQVSEQLGKLTAFCVDNGMNRDDCWKVKDNFATFFRHRFVENYFDTHSAAIDGIGMQSLHEFCRLVADQNIAPEQRKDAILNLSEGVTLCAAGATNNLATAASDLAKEGRGLEGALWKTKENLVRDVLQTLVQSEFQARPYYRGNEIHYVAAVWNYVAQGLGLREVPDDVAPRSLDVRFLQKCEAQVRAQLTPERCVRWIAEEHQEKFNNSFGPGTLPRAGRYEGEAEKRIKNALHDKANWHSFVKLDAIEGGYAYALRSDSTLIAVDLLDKMRERGLLEGQPKDHGSWRNEDRQIARLHTLGEGEHSYAWVSTSAGNSAEDGPADKELPSIDDLVNWANDNGGIEHARPPAAAFFHVLATDAKSLAQKRLAPPERLDEAQALRLFEQLVDEGEIGASYIARHGDALRHAMSDDVKAALADRFMGRNPATSDFILACYPDAIALMAQPRGEHGQSRLSLWMRENNVNAIDAVIGPDGGRRLATAAGFETERIAMAERLFTTLQGDARRPALFDAMWTGDKGAMEAWYRLLTHPEVLPHVTPRLPELLAAEDAGGTPGLYLALGIGHSDAIRVYGEWVQAAGLSAEQKVSLLAAKDADGMPGLHIALKDGNSDAIRVYGECVRAAGLSAEQKVSLLTAKDADGRSGLGLALEYGHSDAIRVYGEWAQAAGLSAEQTANLLAAKVGV